MNMWWAKVEHHLRDIARMVLRDWSSGKLARYTQPASTSTSAPPETSLAEIYAKDDLSKFATAARSGDS